MIGGARTVTGSCFIVESSSGNVMVDCGMFQGPDELTALNRESRSFVPSEIERLVLTHAHIDHSGLIPRLCRQGFEGAIHCHYATADLASIMLPDSGYIQEREIEWENRVRARQGRNLLKPMYTARDAERCLKQFSGLPYSAWSDIGGGFRIRLNDAGHILGSAIVELEALDNGSWRRIVFSGDLGNIHPLILREPSVVEGAECVLCESTYGARIHEPVEEKKRMLKEIINDAYHDSGKVIIPSFAIGRTQEILYLLDELRKDNAVPKIPVYIDSPLAISATEIFQRHPECFDDVTLAKIKSGDSPFEFPGLRLTRDVEDSRKINLNTKPAVVISASGMCEAGRIKHHLKHNLYKPSTHVVFVGFQALGTLGRRIRDGAKTVKIFGQQIAVKAKIHSIGAFSAHADREGLANWLAAMKIRPEIVLVIHGEDKQAISFSEYVHERLGLRTHVPSRGDVIDLDKISELGEGPSHLPEKTVNLIEEMNMLGEKTSDMSGRLARLRDLLESRLIEVDAATVDNLRNMCSSLDSEAISLLKTLDELDVKE